ncbi:spore germination protein [Clostridium sp.]|uniref:spore germination protein n=1 Tax=Clostridium sp. TaxID=1506 RepID=UPI003216A102
MKLSNNITENKKYIQKILPLEKSFDIIGREFRVAGKEAFLVFIDGFAKDDIMVRVMAELQFTSEEQLGTNPIIDLLKSRIPYIEVETFNNIDALETPVLSGALGLIIDGEDTGIIIDAREYPVRGPQEPDLEKVTRGSRDGLVETIIFNTALIRRRVRDPKLVFEITNVGKRSRTDVVIGYIEDLADKALLDEIKGRLEKIDIASLVMAEKTLEELLLKKKWYNPFPQARFSERPDVVAAHLLEGHIAIIVDTSPSVMILPVTLFHFTQHAEDYYQTPIIGTYVRWVRFLGMLSAFILLPLWLLLVYNIDLMPEYLQFLGPKEEAAIPLFIQFIIIEFGLDLLRVSSIHTPNTLSTSLGIVGGLLLGDFAVKVGWVVPETVLYGALVGIGTFATPSVEFSMTIRLLRLILLILTGLFGIYGFIGAMVVIFWLLYSTNSFENEKKYTWPLIPFDGNALMNILFRRPIPQLKRNEKEKD